MTFDKILSYTPINKTASRVVSRRFAYTPDKTILTADQPTPIPTRRVSHGIDLAGHVQGRLTVIGLARDVPKMWVARCVCGTYTTRTAKALRNPCNNHDACETCRHLNYLKRTDYFRRTGKDLPGGGW